MTLPFRQHRAQDVTARQSRDVIKHLTNGSSFTFIQNMIIDPHIFKYEGFTQAAKRILKYYIRLILRMLQT